MVKKSLTWKIGHEHVASTLSTPNTTQYTPVTPQYTSSTPYTPTSGSLRKFDVCELHPFNKSQDYQHIGRKSSEGSPQHKSPDKKTSEPIHRNKSPEVLGEKKQSALSRLPGLNPDGEDMAKYQVKLFRNIKPTPDESEYTQLCRQGGRKDLMHHQEIVSKQVRADRPRVLCFDHLRNYNQIKRRGDIEIPMIEQIRMKRTDNTNINLRSDIVPVENKAKLYFAFNRTKGTITRVIATQPRSFRFGK